MNNLALAKSGSESSISEACDSLKESKKQFEDEKDECCEKEEQQSMSKNLLHVGDSKSSNMSSAKSMTQLKTAGEIVKYRNNDDGKPRRRESKLRSVSHIEQSMDDSDGFEDVAAAVEKGIRPSKSDTSLTESFVMVDSDGGGCGGGRKMSNKQNLLRDGEFLLKKLNFNVTLINFLKLGFKWQKQLVFRSKLTMHTAYDRKDNSEPASITALAVSKDHRTLYVGKLKIKLQLRSH